MGNRSITSSPNASFGYCVSLVCSQSTTGVLRIITDRDIGSSRNLELRGVVVRRCLRPRQSCIGFSNEPVALISTKRTPPRRGLTIQYEPVVPFRSWTSGEDHVTVNVLSIL